jgi:hypothetical protein
MRKVIEGNDLPTVDQNVSGSFAPFDQEDWREIQISNIVSVFLTTEFRVRFEFTSNAGNNIYIDDINLLDGSLISSNEDANMIDPSLVLFPNPTEDVAYIEFDQMISDRGSISLFDLSGRQVKEVFSGAFVSGPQRFEIHSGDIPAGIYFVRIQTDESGFSTRKLVVQ